MDNPYFWILLVCSLAAMVGGSYWLHKQRGGSPMKIDPAKQAKRKARREARREKLSEFGSGVRKGLANLDAVERANIKALMLETAEDVKDVVLLLPKLAAMITSKSPDVVTLGKALAEVQDVAEGLIDLVKAVREGIED
jgi:hypothetical protein